MNIKIKQIEIMKNAIQFIEGFELDNDWKDFKIGNFIITDLEIAIKLVREFGLKNIQLRQDDKVNGGTIEWDNF